MAGPSYLGDGSSGLLLWGAQLEAGSATSYIPTTGAPASRPAESLYAARGIHLDPSYSDLLPAFIGVATPWFLSETTLDVPLRDATYWLERPLQTNLYLGTGTYEGAADLAGQPKPKTRGAVSNITPTLIDPTNRIYQYSDGPGTVVNLYEGANLNILAGADTTDLYSGVTASGTYRTDNSRGLFQLGAAPVAAITVDVTGAFPVAGMHNTAANIARYLLTEDLQLPTANIDIASFTAAAAAYPYAAGVYFPSSAGVAGADAVGLVIGGFAAKLIPTRVGTLRLWAMRALPNTTMPTTVLDTSTIIALTPRALPAELDPPPYRWRVGYNHNYTVQTSGLSVSAAPAQLQYVAAADRYGGWFSGSIGAAYLRPNDPAPIGGALVSATDAATVAADMGALWSVRRRQYDVVVPVSVGIGIEIGDVVSIRYPMDNLASGQLGQVVGDQFRSQDATITLQVII